MIVSTYEFILTNNESSEFISGALRKINKKRQNTRKKKHRETANGAHALRVSSHSMKFLENLNCVRQWSSPFLLVNSLYLKVNFLSVQPAEKECIKQNLAFLLGVPRFLASSGSFCAPH